MHGEGQITANKLTATGACLDYSDLRVGRSYPYIDCPLVIDSDTSFVFPDNIGASYQVAKSLSGTVTGDSVFTVNSHEYKAPLTFNNAEGTVVFPYVATVNGSGSEVDWSAISWDAGPGADPGSSDVVTLNIAGNTTLDFDEMLSVDKLVLNIAEGAELTLSNLSNLTTANGIVLRGTGALKINSATTIAHPITVDDNVSILFSGDSAALTVSGTLTVNSGKTLYIAAANWTTPALAGTRDVITATTLTNNGTISMGAVSGDEGRTYTLTTSGTAVSVMRMTSEAFAYDTYPDGGNSTGWVTSWGEGFDASQLRVGPSETYPYAYFTTDSVHPYGTPSNRGDTLSFSIYADLSQTPSTGKAVIVGFGGAGTANNKLLVLYREESNVKWAVVDRGANDGTTAVLGSAASVALPSGGYHLYTGTFDKTSGNLQLFLDTASAQTGTSAADTTIAGGMQIGNVYQGVAQFKGDHGFVMGTNAAIVAMRGYNVVLTSAEVVQLASEYPATTGAIDRAIQLNLPGKTLTVYSGSETAATTFGPGEGTMVIPAGNTVNVTNFRTYPYENTTGGATAMSIAGTLNVSASDDSTLAAEKGVVLGYYLSTASGTRTTEATVSTGGVLNAPNAYVLMPWSANVASATLNIAGGTVKAKGLMSNQASKGTVNLTDNGLLEVAEIYSSGQAITQNFGVGTFKLNATSAQTQTTAVTFNGTTGTGTTLNANGQTLTFNAGTVTGNGIITIDTSVANSKVVFKGVSGFTGTLTIDDSNKNYFDVESWEGFAGTLNYDVTSESLDLSAYNLASTATVNITGSGATVRLKAGPTVNVSSGATVELVVTEDVYKFDGFLYKGTSSGTVKYYQGTTPTLVTSEYINGNNLLPYYSIFQGHADGDNYVGNLATASDWKNGTDDGFTVPTSRNAAIYVPDGKTLTVTIDNTPTFGEVQIYTDSNATTGGTVIFQQGASGSMTVSSVVCVTAMTGLRIDDTDPGVAFGSGAEINLASGTMVTFNATSYSAPKITGSGIMVVSANKAVTFTGNVNVATGIVNGLATVSSGTLTATSLMLDGTLNMGGNTLSATSVVGTGRVGYTNKLPDASSWATGTASTGWRGTVAFSQTANLIGPNLNSYGNAYSTVALTGVSGDNTYLPNDDITTNVRIEGSVTINNGNPIDASAFSWAHARVVAMPSLDVNGALAFRKIGNTEWNATAYCYYHTSVLKCGTGGSIDIGNQFCLRADAVDFTTAPSGSSCIVPITLTQGGDDKALGVLYGPNGVAGEAIPVTVNGVANGQMLIYATISDASGLYLAVAKVGDTYYTDLATAEAAFEAASSLESFVVYNDEAVTGSYHNLGTVGSVTTYRKQNKNVYYQTGKYWSPNTEGLFKLGDGTVTAAYAGDTIVIDNTSTGDFWADPANAVAATAISVERNVTIKQGEGSGNLFDGKTFTIADGATLTVSGASRIVTLGAATFNKASSTGAVTLDGSTNGITLGATISGTAPITIAGTVTATGKTITNTLKNTSGGTIVYDGTLPDTAPTFDSSWTGTVWLKNYTNLTGTSKQGSSTFGTTNFEPNNYGNSSSTVKFTGVKGYLTAPDDGSYTILPALELEDSDDTPGLLLYNGWGYNASAKCYTIIRELKGSGTLKADPTADGTGGSIKGLNVLLQVLNWGSFSGTLNMMNKNVVFGSTLPDQAVVEGSGKIFVRSGASVTIPSTKTWTCVTNFVDGVLSATDQDRWSGMIVVSDNGVMELTNTDTKSEAETDYSSITGTGTLRYTAVNTSHWRTLPNTAEKRPATTLTLENNVAGGLIFTQYGGSPVAVTEIGSLKGSGKLRSDWGQGSGGDSRSVRINQAKDTEWNGSFDSSERFKTFYITGGASTSGTLTWNDSNTYASHSVQLEVEDTGSFNLDGKWCIGTATVNAGGIFGGTGTVSKVIFNNGSTFKVFNHYDSDGETARYLTATGGVTVAVGDVVWVETTVTPYNGMVLMDWTAPAGADANAAPAGTFRFATEAYRRAYSIDVSGTQLVVVERETDTINVPSDTTTYDGHYADRNLTKTGAGTAKFTGALDDITLTISEGTVELAGATVEDSALFGSGALVISAGTDLQGLTFDVSFSGTVSINMGVMVTVTEDQKTYILTGHESDYTATQNKDGSWTIERALPDTVIPFASNDPNVTVTVPANGTSGTEYVYSYGKIDGVKIGSTPIKLDNFTGMNRVTPFTLSLDVTIPEEIDYTDYATDFGPVLFSFNLGANEIFIMRKSDGVMAARFYPFSSGDSTTDYAAVPEQKIASKVLELGKTYHIELRYWGALFIKDGDTYPVNRGLSSVNTGTSVFVDGVEDWHHTGLRWGSMSLNTAKNGYQVNGVDYPVTNYTNVAETEAAADAAFHANCVFPTNIVIGAATKATATGERVFNGLVVHSAGFLNLAGFQLKVGTEQVHAALPGMTSSDAAATYWYDYGVTASGISGGYALGEQTRYGVGGADNNSTYSRGVEMSHKQSGNGKFTITMGISIPEGSAGGTVCEIPMSDGSITVTYDGATDKFSLNGTAQATAAGDGAHVLVLTYDTAFGAYLWVDSYDETGTRSSVTISDLTCTGKTLDNAIYFGSGSSDSAANNFFAHLGVAYQNVQFGVALCDEADVEAAIESFAFSAELASMPLVEKLKYLANVAHDGASIPVPTITVSGKTLTGYAALNAARILGAYTNTTTTLQMSGYNPASGLLTCAVDPAYAGQVSIGLAGSTNGLVWTRADVAAIPANATSVSLGLGTHAFGSGENYTWFKVLEEAYTNDAPVATGRIHEMLANRPTVDKIFKYGETGWNQDVYRIPAMAATPDGKTVMGIFDARWCYQDLGVPLDANSNGAGPYANPNHYTGIDIGGVFSLDGGETWSYPQVMIDVPNASDPQTGDKTTALTAAMELGDPSIVYDPASEKFIMMGITGGGLTTVHNGAEAVDVVTYECSLASVTNGAPNWTNRTSVKQKIEASLNASYSIQTNGYKTGWYTDGYMGILEGPGHAFVTRAACGSIPANTVVWPMQYVIRNSGIKGGNFAAWKDSGGTWHTTKLVPNSGGTKNYVTQEGCITQLDNGNLLYMCKNVTDGTARPFYVSSDGVSWTYLNEISGLASGSMCQGSMLRIGQGSDNHSRYAAVFATGTLRSDIKVYIGTDTGSGGITWGAEPYETVWAGATGTADDDGDANSGGGPHGNLVYGYNSLVMLNPTTLGVLFEAHGHIYFTKVDVSSALQ